MANYIEYANNLVPGIYVVPTSRYQDSKVIFYGDQRKITFNTFKRTEIPLNENDKYMLITAAYEYRPDLVSQKAYATPDYWWKILLANNINDIIDFKSGITVRLPVTFV